jgi:cysteinyl-tRNA synthetase
MQLRLYDTLTKEKRPFVPLDPKNVRMYVCGPTVYDFAHIGNARPVIVFDVLFRLLRHLYGEAHVTYVRNITDVDDKINDRAARDFPGLPLNEAIRKVTELTEKQFHDDAAALGSLPPTFEPRATDFVLPRADGKADMVTLIKQLIARGNAYEAGGEVLFDTGSMPDYGMLSGRKLDEQLAGARVAVEAHKKNPADFVLWKLSSENEPGWDSPWGRGRPGWHIECSAMSAAYLGDVFDIHGGGLDLIFPHHENELAQSRCAHGTSVMANYWLHNGFVEVEGAKMSKSLGNFRTISEVRADWQGEVIRYQMMMTHYRQPLDWTESISREAQIIVDRWYQFLAEFNGESANAVDASVLAALSDDLNTPEALMRLTALFDRAKKNQADAELFVGTIRFLGFFNQAAEDYFSFYEEAGGTVPKSSPRIPDELKLARDKARAAKDFEKADYLRNIAYLYGYRTIDGVGDGSDLVSARGDFFSISASTRAKLSVAIRHAMATAALSNSPGSRPTLETGFTVKFGHLFNYTAEFNNALREAFDSLEGELRSGAIAEDDLRSTIIDVVLSNLADPARFGPDVVASAALLKLFAGAVKVYEVFFENNVIAVPEDVSWQIGDVAVSNRSELFDAVTPDVQSKFLQQQLSPEKVSSQIFHVRIESSSGAIKYRALTMVRAFISATRLLMYSFDERADILMPLGGGLEASVEENAAVTMLLAKSQDGALRLPGLRRSIPYRLSGRFVEHAQKEQLYFRLSKILSLKLYSSTTRELLALDQLCRARTSDDPFSRFQWNMEAVSTFCRTDEFRESNLRELLEFKLGSHLEPKSLKSLLKLADRLGRLRQRPSFVGQSDALAAQNFAEHVVLNLLASDPVYAV